MSLSTEVGLSQEEANNLLSKFGPNQIREINKTTIPKILFRQVRKNFIIYLLDLKIQTKNLTSSLKENPQQ